MGNAAFYFYGSNSQLITIDLGEGVSELYSEWEIDAATGVSLSGSMRRVTGLYREKVTIQRDRMKGGLELASKLAALQNHLDRGGACAFTADTARSWVFPLQTTPSAGDTRLKCHDNPFYQIFGSNTPSTGGFDDYVALESTSPGTFYEKRKVHATTCAGQFGGTIDLGASAPASSAADGCAFSYGGKPVFARWFRCWPMLKRAQSEIGAPIVQDEHGLLFSLNLTLVSDLHSLFRFHPDQTQFNTGLITETIPPEMVPSNSLATLDAPDGEPQRDLSLFLRL